MLEITDKGRKVMQGFEVTMYLPDDLSRDIHHLYQLDSGYDIPLWFIKGLRSKGYLFDDTVIEQAEAVLLCQK